MAPLDSVPGANAAKPNGAGPGPKPVSNAAKDREALAEKRGSAGGTERTRDASNSGKEPPRGINGDVTADSLGASRSYAKRMLDDFVLKLSASKGDSRRDILCDAAFRVGEAVGLGQLDKADAA